MFPSLCPKQTVFVVPGEVNGAWTSTAELLGLESNVPGAAVNGRSVGASTRNHGIMYVHLWKRFLLFSSRLDSGWWKTGRNPLEGSGTIHCCQGSVLSSRGRTASALKVHVGRRRNMIGRHLRGAKYLTFKHGGSALQIITDGWVVRCKWTDFGDPDHVW